MYGLSRVISIDMFGFKLSKYKLDSLKKWVGVARKSGVNMKIIIV